MSDVLSVVGGRESGLGTGGPSAEVGPPKYLPTQNHSVRRVGEEVHRVNHVKKNEEKYLRARQYLINHQTEEDSAAYEKSYGGGGGQ